MKIKNKIISILLIVALCICNSFTPFTAKSNSSKAYAASKIWSGKVDTSWYTGNKDSYNISTAEQLAGLAKLADEAAHEDRFNGVTINLTADIVLNDVKDFKNWNKKPPKNKWEPIGNQGGAIMGYNPFAGIFKGNGHKIIGLYSSNTEYGFWGSTSRVGLFECICGASISDLVIENAYVESSGEAGALVGVSEGSYVSKVKVINSKIITKDGSAGAIVGSCHKFVNTYLISFMLLAATGVFVNPLLYKDEVAEEIWGEHGTIISDCRVNNVTVEGQKNYDKNSLGGMVGGGRLGAYNCLVSNLTIKTPEAASGIIVPVNPATSDDIYIKKCSFYACKIVNPCTDKAANFADIKSVKRTKKDAKIKVGAKSSALSLKNIKKKGVTINLKCSTNSSAKLNYKVTSTPKKGTRYIKVSRSGKVTIKKKAPRGKYVVTVSVKGNDRYTSATKKISIKVN